MTTFAYAIFQMIRRSRPGNRMVEGPKIEFRNDADPEKMNQCKTDLFIYESTMRGHSHLLKKPLLECNAEEIALFQGRTAYLIKALSAHRWLLTDECRETIMSLPAPDGRIMRSAFDAMISPRLRKISREYEKCSLYWWGSQAQLTLSGGKLKKEFKSTADANSIFRAQYSNIGEMYDAFWPLMREIEKEIEGIIKNPASWPRPDKDIAEGEDKAKLILQKLMNRLTKEERDVLRENPIQYGKLIHDFLAKNM